ncbi:MAG: DUF4390 domain-containing protein [Burkholderiales bacterium]|nr:DUF4390 domain-containing protein [Burkholderiales bacterium]
MKNRFSALAAALAFTLACVAPNAAHAEGISVKNAELVANDEWYFLNADFSVGLTPALEEALNKGISLNFMLEFELTRSRWYWLDESIASVRQNLRISYHALTRQYHFSGNSGNKAFNTLTEAKDELNRVLDWKVLDRHLLKKGTPYNAAVRMRLDVKQLPKPLQVDALGSKDWDLVADWHRFTITP